MSTRMTDGCFERQSDRMEGKVTMDDDDDDVCTRCWGHILGIRVELLVVSHR